MNLQEKTYDFAVIGSGFGGSVSAMRLAEKGYSVAVLERGKRFRDQDFAKTNWNIFKFLWAPKLRSFGILQISPFDDVLVLHGSGVGGGSLGYACVLMQPSDKMFEAPAWGKMTDWKNVLQPHYDTANRMLGVTKNPQLWSADEVLRSISANLETEETYRSTDVGIFFGDPEREGEEVPDPYFDGRGPARSTCIHCGGCMVGCRYNAKNTLEKNYLYFAEKWGAQILPECEVRDVRPLTEGQPDGARYEVVYRSSTAWFFKSEKRMRARNVVFSAGALGTLRLLYRCRDITGSMPDISPRLGDMVRTNSEALTGAVSRSREVDYSKGVAISSFFNPDPVSAAEPVRYPAGSSLMRLLSGPLVQGGRNFWSRFAKSLWWMVTHPLDFLRAYILPGWAQRTTILLVMQTEDNRMRIRLGRKLLTLFRRDLVSVRDEEARIPSKIEVSHHVTREFAEKTGSIPLISINEGLFDTPVTAHILGGCPIGKTAQDGVVDVEFRLHNYPGIYVVDGSIVPANPGVNPSLTITALAEYAMSCIVPKGKNYRFEKEDDPGREKLVSSGD